MLIQHRTKLASQSHISGGIYWTFHAQDKMRFYRLSEARVKRVLNNPKRVEEGVAPKTLAIMQPNSVSSVRHQASSSEKREMWKQEIWVMAQKVSGVKGQAPRVKIISAWRYPGMSKPRSEAIKNLMKQEYEQFASRK